MELAETNCHILLMKKDIHIDVKAFASLQRGLILLAIFKDHNIGQTKELENDLILLLCRNRSIIHIICKKNKIQASGKTGTAAPSATNVTFSISNTSLTSTSTASDSTTSSLINANKITVCS